MAATGLLLPATSASAQSAPAPAPSLDVEAQTPYVAPEGSFLLSLGVRGAPAGSHIETVLYRPAIANRAAFNKTLFGVGLGDADEQVTLPKINLSATNTRRQQTSIGISLVQQQSGGEGRISLERGLTEGVHPVEVRLVGPDGKQLDRIITYLVRLPEDMSKVQPLRAAMVFDVHAPPSVDPSGRTHLATKDLDRIGALAQALKDHDDSRITLVPTPETIEALAREPGRPGKLLERLQATLPHAQVVDQPYVDVPVSSWIEAGMQDELNQQRERGNAALTDHLKRPDRTTWIGSPDLTSEAAAELWEGGVTRFVLPEESFSPAPADDGTTETARPFELATRVDAPVQAIALDGSLDYLLLDDQVNDPELQSLQLISELSVIQGEAKDEARGVVFGVTDRRPFSSRVVSDTLDLLQDNPLVRSSSVAEVFDDVAPARTGGTGGPVVKRLLSPTPSPDLGDYPSHLRDIQAHIASYSQVLPPSDREAASWQQRLLVSGARELTPATRDQYIDVIQATIANRVRKVQSPPRQTVTLTSREGEIPFTVRNELKKPVRVMLELDGGPRVEFPDGTTRIVSVEPGIRQFPLRVSTRTPGVVPVTVRVMSPDRGLLMASSKVAVRSTAVSGIGYVLTIGAAGFLVVWWFRHWRRSRREREVTAASPLAT